jgi:hypothetical protein
LISAKKILEVIVPSPIRVLGPTKERIFFGSKKFLSKILSLFEGHTTTLTYIVVRETNFH